MPPRARTKRSRDEDDDGCKRDGGGDTCPTKRGCVRQTTAQYTKRKSPPYPANECQGRVMKGNDVKSYRLVPDKRGFFRWTIDKNATVKHNDDDDDDEDNEKDPKKVVKTVAKPTRKGRATDTTTCSCTWTRGSAPKCSCSRGGSAKVSDELVRTMTDMETAFKGRRRGKGAADPDSFLGGLASMETAIRDRRRGKGAADPDSFLGGLASMETAIKNRRGNRDFPIIPPNLAKNRSMVGDDRVTIYTSLPDKRGVFRWTKTGTVE